MSAHWTETIMPNPITYRRRSPKADFERVRARRPMWPLVLAEGDSWFDHPLLRNILYQLHGRGGFAIRRIARIGDTLHNMVREVGGCPEYVRRLASRRTPYKLMLVSAGGNDILGEKLEDLLQETPPDADPRRAINRDAWGMVLYRVREDYQRLIARTLETRADCQIIAHGYDYPFPRDEGATIFWKTVTGPWLQPVMNSKGIEHPPKQREIIKLLIDDLHDKVLRPLHDEVPAFHLVDLRNTLRSKKDWDDEIHPTSDGFRKLAAKIRKRMVKVS